MKEHYGFIYEWTNNINGMKYIGSHYGKETDGYIGSGKAFSKAYEKNPSIFSRKILEYIYVDDKKEILDTEQKWLDTVPDIQHNKSYYNINPISEGGWEHINSNPALIEKRNNTLRQRQQSKGLTDAERNSYKQKIESRLERQRQFGFSEAEKLQHKSYGYELKVTHIETNETSIFNSLGEATRQLGIDAAYGSRVCRTKPDFKGYKFEITREPLIDCRTFKK